MSQKRKHSHHRKKNSAARGLLIAGIAFLLLAILVVGGIYALFEHYYGKLAQPEPTAPPVSVETVETPVPTMVATPSPEDSPMSEIEALEANLLENFRRGAQELAFDDDVYHILLIGCDAANGGSSRSDSMVVVSINRRSKTITLTSLMRDIYLTIPDHWNDRLNAAYAYGGAELLLETIQSNFGIPVEDYVMVDFQSFRDVVDVLGGVTVDLSEAELEAVNAQVWENEADRLDAQDIGETQLNGNQALAYARLRSVGASDFDRTGRQREVLSAMFEKARQLRLMELNELANALLPHVATDLTRGETFDILLHAMEYLSYDLESFRIPADGTYEGLTINGMAVLGIDFETNRQVWYELVYAPAGAVSNGEDS